MPSVTRGQPFRSACRAQPRAHRSFVKANAVNRRDAVLQGSTLLGSALLAAGEAGAEVIEVPITQLSTFERSDQKKEVQKRAEMELAKVLTRDDAPQALRLVFFDAATYDAKSKSGGMNGSIVLSPEESSWPETKALSALLKKIETAKAAVDKGNAELGSGPLSWADALVLAAKVAVQQEWRDIKISRSATQSGGDQIVKAFGSAWDVRMGRMDSPEASGVKPPVPGADTAAVKEFMLKLGAKPGDGGPFSPKPPFWEKPMFVTFTAIADDPAAEEQRFAAADPFWADTKKGYDRERKTTTRTAYEVDFINNFTKLAALGAKFDDNAYLHTVKGVRLN